MILQLALGVLALYVLFVAACSVLHVMFLIGDAFKR